VYYSTKSKGAIGPLALRAFAMANSLPVLSPTATASLASEPFRDRLERSKAVLRGDTVRTLQVNLGKLCNQACKHCHVDAGPARTEIMSRQTVEQVADAVAKHRVPTLDITGGAPELNPSFRFLVSAARSAGAHVIVRHNLTVLFEPGQGDLPQFFAEQRVEVVSSLPYYLSAQTDAQRGGGVFEKSIEAMRRLNAVGFGRDDSGLTLNLVFNPVGAYLPPSQGAIQADFKRELSSRYGVVFNELFTITNMPISRFLDYLRRTGNVERYMQKLVDAFNPATVDGLMCRTLVSVDWQGRLFDCDFNQMVDLGVASDLPQSISDFDPDSFRSRRIVTADHCYGCTAGSGSSCGGALATP
jgi:radical SAM/Cys-rich protein